MHLTTLIAASLALFTSSSAARYSIDNSPPLDKRSLTTSNSGSDILSALLDERGIANFFSEDAHNTPRHARPVFQSASSHKLKKRHGHSKRATGTCHKKASSSSSSSGSSDNGSSWSSVTLGADRAGATASSTPSSSSSSASQAKSTSSSSGTISPITTGSDSLGGVGLFSFVDTKCGKSGATEDVTKTAGPNGAMDWLNCGINDANGWTPPDVKLKDILVMSLDEALEEDNSPFQACKPYLSIFDKYAQEYDLPAILIASIAMQESTCNKDASGDNGGAHGLMQITSDKCTSGISCSDPDYNVKTGAKYLKDQLDTYNGNVLLAMGAYNGWYKGLTVAKATAIKDSCCECQNNINYHMQMLNGWLLNKNGYELGDWNMGC